MKAVILCGGKGTRMGNIAAEIPKPMLPVGGKPVLLHQVELLKRYGITEIIMITAHLADVIENYFSDGKKFGVSISYYRETTPLGTTGGLKEIEEKLDSDFLLLYGDVMVNMNLARLIEFHREKKATATLVVHPNSHPYDSDLLEADASGRIIGFHPKPHDENSWYHNLVNAALYAFSPAILKHIQKGVKADFGKDIFPKIFDGEALYAYRTAEYLKDMGTPERLEQVNSDYASGKIERLNLEHKRKAIFLDRDGVINEEVNLLHKIEDFRLIPGAASAIAKINKSEYLAIVVTNQSVIARGLCTIPQLDEIHKKMETLLGREGAYIDALYYCPHHPDKGYPDEVPEFKIDCECRKPKIGMIKKAVADFNIDLNGSFIIGDSERDVLTGKNAGIRTIALRSGEGCKECKVEPDYFFDTLTDAVEFIIDEPYKEYAQKVVAAFQKSAKKPFVIGVGGKSRTGKSTFSRYLIECFEKIGKKALIVLLDNWLIPLSERNEEDNVYTRFQIEKASDDIRKILSGESVSVKKYEPLLRSNSDERVEYNASGYDVIIVEGVTALSYEKTRKMYALKIFMRIPDNLFMKRVFSIYLWKGLNNEEIKSIIEKRGADEYSLIAKEERFADLIIN
jgi:histidinol-phosphate phosphatase family protein